VNIAGTALLLVLLRRRLGRIELGETASASARIVAAALPLAGVSFAVWYALDRALGRSFGGQVVSLGLALAAGAATYLFSCRLLRVREAEALLSLRARLRRR
jgi:putative peptidoglycan lipid II flippase